MKLCVFAVLVLSVVCQLNDEGSLYSEKKALSEIPKRGVQKIKAYVGEKFTIDLPSTFLHQNKWMIRRIRGRRLIKCEGYNEKRTSIHATAPLPPTEPKLLPGQTDQAQLVMRPRQAFVCYAVRPGKSKIELWFRMLGKEDPDIIYKVRVKVVGCRSPCLSHRKH